MNKEKDSKREMGGARQKVGERHQGERGRDKKGREGDIS
jgi:hypothetical protein